MQAQQHSRQVPMRHASLCITDGVAEFTHQRAAARNALSLEMRQDYHDMLDHVEADRAIHATETLAEEARRFARRFLAAPPQALALAKRALNRSFESSYDTVLEREAQGQALASAVPYYAQAVDEFLHGRPARFDWDRDGQG
ncbi:hypothetical protein CNECB9_5360010 [Cupriavidus necator]|uniref:Uncharacterized protein n=1 Tax=Cupriavidus necator TaxID=106590 RepID=A0A1K0IQH2_CUPNE|nr:hypothetical protein CNECB9_5360010 [Cupriavidus necator]